MDRINTEDEEFYELLALQVLSDGYKLFSCYLKFHDVFVTPIKEKKKASHCRFCFSLYLRSFSYFLFFSLFHKANLHQLQQPCNLRDKGSYLKSRFPPRRRKKIYKQWNFTAEKRKCHFAGEITQALPKDMTR